MCISIGYSITKLLIAIRLEEVTTGDIDFDLYDYANFIYCLLMHKDIFIKVKRKPISTLDTKNLQEKFNKENKSE